MNIQLLIDAIVRQTTVLIAQLATTGGARAPLAHVANQVFLELAQELESQGVSRKVSADMFGMALRAYLKKIQRLAESSSIRGRSLWEAVLEYLSENEVRTKAEVLNRFRHDDEVVVRGVLHDLVESGLAFSAGSATSSVYRATTDEERGALLRGGQGLGDFIWALVYREGPLTSERLLQLVGAGGEEVGATLAQLEATGRIVLDAQQGYSAKEFYVPLGSAGGWEAAMYDHYQALVKTLVTRLSQSQEGAKPTADTGGSTYTFDVWPGHPHHDAVVGTLATLRGELTKLREAVEQANQATETPEAYKSVVVYVGQCTTLQP
ncbi:MAG: hypothetical protein RJA70_1487 [Pseudomonadota bacterium]|jgi:hypothetical protein